MLIPPVSALVYDCEIIKAVPDKRAPREVGVQYCEGWSDFRGMGISVLCAYDCLEQRARIFGVDNLTEFERLAAERTLIAGFNNHSFDNNLIAAQGYRLPRERSWDFFEAACHACGGPEERYTKGRRQDDWCKANALPGKSGQGAHAPILWQRGRIAQVIDYCMTDVDRLVRLIALLLARDGHLLDPVRQVDVRFNIDPWRALIGAQRGFGEPVPPEQVFDAGGFGMSPI